MIQHSQSHFEGVKGLLISQPSIQASAEAESYDETKSELRQFIDRNAGVSLNQFTSDSQAKISEAIQLDKDLWMFLKELELSQGEDSDSVREFKVKLE